MIVKAVAYPRVSSALHQDPKHQLVPIRDLSKNRNFDLIGEYVDRISGTTPNQKRKALDELVKQARLVTFKVVIIYALDRLARDVRFLLNLLHELNEYGVSVISLRENLDLSSPIGRAVLGVIGVISQLEGDLNSERIKTALADKTYFGNKFQPMKGLQVETEVPLIDQLDPRVLQIDSTSA